MEDYPFHIGVFLVMAVLVAMVFFCWQVHQILRQLPRENQRFPAWFVWFFLIPWVGLIFRWMMLPFSIPETLKKTFSADQGAVRSAKVLFWIGLTQVAFATINLLFPNPIFNLITAAAWIILWILYWILILRFKRIYLKVQKGAN